MLCKACKSENLQRLDGELTVSLPNLKELRIPPVYVSETVLTCLDCGFTELTIPARELQLLQNRESAPGS